MSKLLYLKLHLLVALYATTAILGHLISLPAASLVIWRTSLAAVGAAVWILLIRRERLRLPLRSAGALLGIGMLVGLHWFFFFAAIKVANISICLAGLATASFFTALSEPFFEKRRVRPLEILLGLIVLVGISLVAGFERGNALGLGFALCSAVLASIFPVLNRRLTLGGLHPRLMVFWEMVGACLICLIGLPFISDASGYANLLEWQKLDFLWLLLLAWVCTVFAHSYHIRLLQEMSAYTTNLAINFEPVYGILAAAVFFHEYEQLHPGFYIGTATVLIANVLHPLILRHLARRKTSAQLI